MRQKVEFIQLEMTSSVFRPRRSSKALRKDPNLHQKKKVMVTLLRSANGLIHYSFLNPSETITSEKYAQQISEMHPKLPCLQPAVVNRKGRTLLHDNTPPCVTQPTLQRLNELGYEVLLIHHIHLTSHQQTTTSSSILTLFFRESTSITSRRQKMLSKSSLNSKQTYFLLIKMC